MILYGAIIREGTAAIVYTRRVRYGTSVVSFVFVIVIVLMIKVRSILRLSDGREIYLFIVMVKVRLLCIFY